MAKRKTKHERFMEFLEESADYNFLGNQNIFPVPAVKDIVNFRGKEGEVLPTKLKLDDLDEIIEKISGEEAVEAVNEDSEYDDAEFSFFVEGLDDGREDPDDLVAEFEGDDDTLEDNDESAPAEVEDDDLDSINMDEEEANEVEDDDMNVDELDTQDESSDDSNLDELDLEEDDYDVVDDDIGDILDNDDVEVKDENLNNELNDDEEVVKEITKPSKSKKNSLNKAPLSILEENSIDFDDLSRLLVEMTELDRNIENAIKEDIYNESGDTINEEIMVDTDDDEKEVEVEVTPLHADEEEDTKEDHKEPDGDEDEDGDEPNDEEDDEEDDEDEDDIMDEDGEDEEDEDE